MFSDSFFADNKTKSEREILRLGYPVNVQLPSLDGAAMVKGKKDIAYRALSIYSAIAVAFGCNQELALDWLNKNGIYLHLSTDEKNFIETGDCERPVEFQQRVESLWAAMWVLGKVNDLSPESYCGDNLVKLFPDILRGDTVAEWMDDLSLREDSEIFAVCDLYYRLHWALNDELIKGVANNHAVGAYVIIQRRRFLEWVISNCDWSDVAMDT